MVNGRELKEGEKEKVREDGAPPSTNAKTRAFQSWLFCYELTDTLIAITKDSSNEHLITIYCAQNKGIISSNFRNFQEFSSI